MLDQDGVAFLMGEINLGLVLLTIMQVARAQQAPRHADRRALGRACAARTATTTPSTSTSEAMVNAVGNGAGAREMVKDKKFLP